MFGLVILRLHLEFRQRVQNGHVQRQIQDYPMDARNEEWHGNPYIPQQTQHQWFSPAAFAIPTFAFGNFGREVLRGPAYYNSDLSLFKNIPIHERITTQIRVEAFSTLNLMTYANPATWVGSSDLGVISNVQGAPRTPLVCSQGIFLKS